MKLVRSKDRMGEADDLKPPKGSFSGKAVQQPLHEATGTTWTSLVRFDAGAHTHWHSHAGGQVLQPLDGRLRVETWGGEAEVLEPGDLVIATAGEKHWHGATTEGPMTQLAVTTGEVLWMEGVEGA